MNRFLLLGEHVLLLESLAALLQPALDADARVQRLAAAAASVNGWRPDLLIVDTADTAGAAPSIRAAIAAAPEARLLVIGPNEPEHLLAALKLGARGFLPRDCTTDQLVNCITAIQRGQLAIPRGMVDLLLENYVELLSKGTTAPRALTGREPRILELLAHGQNAGEIASVIYVSEGTIRTDIRLLLQKFGVANRAQLLTEALRLDLVPSAERRALNPHPLLPLR